MNQKNNKHKSIKELKEFWDGPKVGFDEELYNEYLRKKKAFRERKRKILMNSINLN